MQQRVAKASPAGQLDSRSPRGTGGKAQKGGKGAGAEVGLGLAEGGGPGKAGRGPGSVSTERRNQGGGTPTYRPRSIKAKGKNGALERVSVPEVKKGSNMQETVQSNRNPALLGVRSLQNVGENNQVYKGKDLQGDRKEVSELIGYQRQSPESNREEMTPSHSEYTLYTLPFRGGIDGELQIQYTNQGLLQQENQTSRGITQFTQKSSSISGSQSLNNIGQNQPEKRMQTDAEQENIQLEQEFFETVRDTMRKHFSDALQSAVGKIKIGLRTVEERERHIINFYESLINEEGQNSTTREDQSLGSQSDSFLNQNSGRQRDSKTPGGKNIGRNQAGMRDSDKHQADRSSSSKAIVKLFQSDNPKHALLRVLTIREAIQKTSRDIELLEHMAEMHYKKRLQRNCIRNLNIFREKRAQYKGQTDQNEELYLVSQRYNKMLEDLEAEIRETVKETARVTKEKQILLEKSRENGYESLNLLDSSTAKRTTLTNGTEACGAEDRHQNKNEDSSNKKYSGSQGQSSENPTRKEKKGESLIQYVKLQNKNKPADKKR